jgi:LmbE family N-acetylglucosaminyl deacetylase
MSCPKLKVMAFCAHSADSADLAGGTLAKYANNGHEVMVVMLSLGAKSHVMKSTGLEELRAIKRGEAERAYAHLGVQHVRCLEYEEDPLVLGRQEITDMVNIIREFGPDIVITHHPSADVVPDHAEAGRAVRHACHCAGRPGFDSALPIHIVPNLFVHGLGITDRGQRLTGSPAALPDVYVDITDTIQQKMDALAEFATQHYTAEFNERRKHGIEGHYGLEVGVTYAEAFYSMRPIVMDELPLSKGAVNFGRKVEGTRDR